MKSPELLNVPRLTREEIEASFRPCPICGEVEKSIGGGVYRIDHDMERHGLSSRNRSPRMSTEDLMSVRFADCERVLERLEEETR